jgi:hypothetical protein
MRRSLPESAARLPLVRQLLLRRTAALTYRQLVANGETRPLGRREVRLADEYAHDVLGDRIHTWALRLYTAVSGEFRVGWIPDEYFAGRVMPAISSRAVRTMARVRTLMTPITGLDGVPEIAIRVGQHWFDRDRRPTTRSAVADAAEAFGPTVVVKADGSQASQGVEVLSTAALRDSEPMPGVDVVVQRFVTPHPLLDELSPGATAPVRLLTVMRDGAPELIASHLRLAAGVSRTAGGVGALRIAVSTEGVVGDLAADGDWRLHRSHPTTGARFAGLRIPSFEAAVARCLDWHRLIPQAGVVGWDVAIDEGGAVQLLEWNMRRPGLDYHEALSGPNFTDLGWERFARKRRTDR